MRSKRTVTGLRNRNGIWYISKVVRLPGGSKTTLQESTGCRDLALAESFLHKRVQDVMDEHVHGVVSEVLFADCASRYLEEHADLKSIDRAGYALANVVPEIGHMKISGICDESLESYKRKRTEEGIAAGTLNRELGIIRRILILASRKWRHGGRPLLQTPPLISDVSGKERKAHILTRKEEARLLAELPEHLQDAVIFSLNTGLRQSEQTGLRWKDEQYVEGLDKRVFVVRNGKTKNSVRVVPLNEAVMAVVDRQRGNTSEYVFEYAGHRYSRFNNHAFRKARKRACLPDLTWHSLRHTYATRLRAAQVSLEDRAALLGHAVTGGEITTRYSAPEIGALIGHVERLDEESTDVVVRTLQTSAMVADEKAVLH